MQGLHRDTMDILSNTSKNAYAPKSKVQAAKDRTKSAVNSNNKDFLDNQMEKHTVAVKMPRQRFNEQLTPQK